ncbi:hypothetical protein RYX36_030611 [Vicia faba]
MAVNVKCGVSFLTQVTVTNLNKSEAESQAIEAAKAKAALANACVDEAKAEAALANTRADEAKVETTELAKQFEVAPSTAPSTNHEYEYDKPLTDAYVSNERE